MLAGGNLPVKVNQKSDPLPVDWDGDGQLDLLVGHCERGESGPTSGRVFVFLRK